MESFRTIQNCCISEFLGTMLFVFCGTASTLRFDTETPPSKESIGFAFGLSFAVLLNLTASWSCGYFNTAVTIARMIRRRISPLFGLCCIAVQFVGGILGSGLLYLLSPDNIQKSDLGATRLGVHVPLYTGVCVELIMTFLLVITVLLCADGSRKMSDSETALWSGLVYVGCHLASFHITGCGMNPARSLGPAVISGVWELHWVYWVGPILGSILACLLHYLATNFPVITDEDMAVKGEGIDLDMDLEVVSDKIVIDNDDDHLSDKNMPSPILPDSPRLDQVPTEMKTYM
ncbi:aquaporin-5-like [Actinia tenebrosa]|uniref:Aquaporin-5-like n=1 Tax=Actinia tenebrosa TaxID=6105 RepID=A0A6P8H130_ACTTE|nr:aquaporin-5-like [Actinia tenebrosa]